MGSITEYAGDIFTVPEGSVIIHACNCVGEWGAGFAAALRQKFPAAYKLYHSTCQPPTTAPVRELLGTALLIAPQSSDLAKSGRYWIACLFTSTHYGAKKDKPTAILESTRRALDSLKKQVEATDSELDLANKLWAVRINAKAFRTPWGRTRRILAESGLDIKIMNNLTIMSKAERQKTVQEMEEMGFDPEAAPPFTK